MKTLRFFGLQIDLAFCINRVKRITFDIPYWADDCSVRNTEIPYIKYYKNTKSFTIDLPKCKKAVQVSLDVLTRIVDSKKIQNTNRKIVVDIYLW